MSTKSKKQGQSRRQPAQAPVSSTQKQPSTLKVPKALPQKREEKSSSKSRSVSQANEESATTNQDKARKDRSKLVGMKRTRKSRDQIYLLQKCFEDAKGKPTKQQLKQLSKDTGLKLQQVYKWYWDTEKKNDKLHKELRNSSDQARNAIKLTRKILKTQYTDEFGGYSKTWFTDGLQEMKNLQNQELSRLKLPSSEQDRHDDDKSNLQQDFSMEGIARALGLNIEKLAIELALKDDILPAQILPVSNTLNCLNETSQAK
mmetsp:Transcript_17556/g.29627  ORF Transcript_17556/g.29627 Transcript_17556/m.29627 type:complete len:259 (+) Transcript_17556:470-1246(+)